MSERTRPLYVSDPPAGFESWRDYFRAAKDAYKADPEAAVPTEADTKPTILERGEADPGPGGPLLRGPKKAAGMALGLGWETTLRWSRIRVPAVLYKDTSDEHNAGDVRFAEREETWWFLTARARGVALGFHAAYLETATASGGRGFSFDHARAVDPVGVPRELYHDYSAQKVSKIDPRETAQSVAARQAYADRNAEFANAMFNDGADWIDRRPMFKAAKEFEAWMGDWVELLAPAPELEVAA